MSRFEALEGRQQSSDPKRGICAYPEESQYDCITINMYITKKENQRIHLHEPDTRLADEAKSYYRKQGNGHGLLIPE